MVVVAGLAVDRRLPVHVAAHHGKSRSARRPQTHFCRDPGRPGDRKLGDADQFVGVLHRRTPSLMDYPCLAHRRPFHRPPGALLRLALAAAVGGSAPRASRAAHPAQRLWIDLRAVPGFAAGVYRPHVCQTPHRHGGDLVHLPHPDPSRSAENVHCLHRRRRPGLLFGALGHHSRVLDLLHAAKTASFRCPCAWHGLSGLLAHSTCLGETL